MTQLTDSQPLLQAPEFLVQMCSPRICQVFTPKIKFTNFPEIYRSIYPSWSMWMFEVFDQDVCHGTVGVTESNLLLIRHHMDPSSTPQPNSTKTCRYVYRASKALNLTPCVHARTQRLHLYTCTYTQLIQVFEALSPHP